MSRAFRRIRFLAGVLGLALVINALPVVVDPNAGGLGRALTALTPAAEAAAVAAPGEYKSLP